MLQKIVVISFLILSISSCAPNFITNNSLSHLHKGMSRSEVDKILDVEPAEQFTITHKNTKYDIVALRLLTGISVSSSSSPRMGGAGMMTTTTTTHHTNYTFFLYAQNKLLYWGMKNEYSKSEDTFIAELSPEIYKHHINN
ncbi:MAG: hypothetical protein ACK5C0_01545 [Candidatus Kapaibacterium sp.]|jgi:hypothetical protein